MKNGWIKLHRKLLESLVANRPSWLSLWVTLLLKANHEPKKFMWNGNIILIKEGQMITGRKELSQQTGIPETTIEDILQFLEKQHQIRQQKTTKYRLITIVNWVKHQSSDTKSVNKATTKRQQSDTNKNDKKYKNDKKDSITEQSSVPWVLEEKLQEMESKPNSYLDIIASFIREKPVRVENSAQLSNVIKRYARVAKSLSGAYTNNQIFSAAEKIQQDNKRRSQRGDEVDWTLETVYKILTK